MIASYQSRCQALVDSALQQLFQPPLAHMQRLYQAMGYSVMNGGKRVRPLLVFASCEAVGGRAEQAVDAACAVELIHAYSLVHDDLPAMDNDAWRRGQPTTHVAFDEAYAILAGDALQALAFEVLCRNPHNNAPNADTRLRMLQILAGAAGAAGMVGGQAIDLSATGQQIDQQHLEQMHRHKTGALIRASVLLGALASGNADQQSMAQLSDYADAIGLAYQVQDDILDIVSDSQTLGKTQGSDQQQDKSTYPKLLGLDAARAYALQLRDQALDALQQLPASADQLRQIANYIVARQS